jgi:microcystin degradation protein MlrC
LLQALIDNGAQRAVLAILHDPEVASRAHALGTGSSFEAALGGKSGFVGATPYRGRFAIEALSDGVFEFTGAMYRGSTANLGPMAVLRVLDADCDLRVIVGSVRDQCLDQAMMTHLGVEPAAQAILAVKSSVHFRADFDPIAAQTLLVAAPGAHPCRLAEVNYRNLREGVRLEPLGPEHRRER